MRRGEPIPISIRGTHYPSARAAARALGVSYGTIYYHLNAGTLDRAGITPTRGLRTADRRAERAQAMTQDAVARLRGEI